MEKGPETKIKWAFTFKGPARSGKSYAADVVKAYFSVPESAEVVEIIAFADVLKRICAVFLGWDDAMAMADSSKSLPVSKVEITPENIKAATAILCARPYEPEVFIEEFGMEMELIAACLETAVITITVCLDPAAPSVRAFTDGTTYGRVLQLMGTEGMRTHISKRVFPNYVLAEARRRGVTVLICPDARFDEEIEMTQELNGFAARIVPGAGFVGLQDGRSTAHASENTGDKFGLPTITNNFDAAFSADVREWIGAAVASTAG
jgi:hypothetical protein